ncbi:MAG: hypothetical protein HY319_00360 [Armatimonadetes bacterium]|nr:hypothetical protein [Armatimonadota bacterium]
MPAGDAQRVWFPKMLEELKSTWSTLMTWEELADFCEGMTEQRRGIRQALGIKPPRMRCPKCGQVSRSSIAGVSIRSALFALKNVGVVTAAEFEELDRNWKRHKARHALDAYGRNLESRCGRVDNPLPCCEET